MKGVLHRRQGAGAGTGLEQETIHAIQRCHDLPERLVLGEFRPAIRIDEGADVAEDKARSSGRLTSQPDGAMIDFFETIFQSETRQTRGMRLKRVGQQYLGTRVAVCLVNRSYLLRMRLVPEFMALAGIDTGALQFGAHCAVHEQHTARMQRVEKARHVMLHICQDARRGPSPAARDTSPGSGQDHHADIAPRRTPSRRPCGTTSPSATPAPDASCGCASCSAYCDRR